MTQCKMMHFVGRWLATNGLTKSVVVYCLLTELYYPSRRIAALTIRLLALDTLFTTELVAFTNINQISDVFYCCSPI